MSSKVVSFLLLLSAVLASGCIHGGDDSNPRPVNSPARWENGVPQGINQGR